MPQNLPQPPKRRRALARFKRSEATRLLQGTLDAKLPVRGIEVDPVSGALRVLVGGPGPVEPGNDLDSWLKRKDAHQA